MARVSEQMRIMDAELARIRSEIDRLRAQEEVIVKLRAQIGGEPVVEPKQPRKRSGSVKPVVIDYMQQVGFTGATSAEVDEAVRKAVPDVARDTVGSILSRLKSDGALVYVRDRYYVKQFAPNTNAPFDQGLSAVN